MPAALPMALRARFQDYITEGLSGRAAASRLKVSAATGVRWLRKIRERGEIAPEAQGRPKGHGKLAPHRALLEELVAQDGVRRQSFWYQSWFKLSESLAHLVNYTMQRACCDASVALRMSFV